MAGAIFMLENGWENEAVDWYLKEFEDIVVWIAEDKVSKVNLLFALKCVFFRFNQDLMSKDKQERFIDTFKVILDINKELELKVRETSSETNVFDDMFMQTKLAEKILLK